MRRNRFSGPASFAAVVALTLLLGAQAFADVIHLYNGRVVRGRLDRVTGDIIEVKPHPWSGDLQVIQRLSLTNRRDVVETRNHERLFGEIKYFDRFRLEIQTESGLLKVNRLMVKNVVLGSPSDQPVNDYLETNRQPGIVHEPQPAVHQGKPVVHYPLPAAQPRDIPSAQSSEVPVSLTQPRLDINEDEDAIPDPGIPKD